MSIELTMPRLSDTMEAGTIIKWNVEEGAEVAAGTVVADIETDKATMEMQVFDDGTIARILVDEGTQVSVGTVIAVLAEEDESVDDVKAAFADGAKATATANAASASTETEAGTSTSSEPESKSRSESAGSATTSTAPSMPPASSTNGTPASGGRLRVSPVARRMAEEKGIDLGRLAGSGPGGRIIKRDVERAIADGGTAAGAAPTAITSSGSDVNAPLAGATLQAAEEPLSGIRQTIARRLVESKQSIPHYQVSMRIEMDALLSLRGELNEQLAEHGVKLSVNDFIVRACALAMHQHRHFNASFGGDKVIVHGAVNVGVAVALTEERGGGLVVAVVRDADRKGLRQISAEAKALAEKARTRGLSPEDMSDSTFTISNLGMFGVDHFTAIINPPNSAILACGGAIEQPVVRNGALTVGHQMTATLSLDHRVIDGAMAARYLQTVKGLLEKPATLLV